MSCAATQMSGFLLSRGTSFSSKAQNEKEHHEPPWRFQVWIDHTRNSHRVKTNYHKTLKKERKKITLTDEVSSQPAYKKVVNYAAHATQVWSCLLHSCLVRTGDDCTWGSQGEDVCMSPSALWCHMRLPWQAAEAWILGSFQPCAACSLATGPSVALSVPRVRFSLQLAVLNFAVLK